MRYSIRRTDDYRVWEVSLSDVDSQGIASWQDCNARPITHEPSIGHPTAGRASHVIDFVVYGCSRLCRSTITASLSNDVMSRWCTGEWKYLFMEFRGSSPIGNWAQYRIMLNPKILLRRVLCRLAEDKSPRTRVCHVAMSEWLLWRTVFRPASALALKFVSLLVRRNSS